uniref:WD repeat-containing protein 54 beta-propeller domain-containing protein n=1 Tax=Panagrolaimus superbus TaxID=310955 RepID=A0A914Y0X1_9BILA
MFEFSNYVDISSSVGAFTNNVSVYYYEPKFTTFVAVCAKNQVNLVQWDAKMGHIKTDIYQIREKDDDAPEIVIQAKLVAPTDRNLPVLVITTLLHVRIYDIKTQKVLLSIMPETPKPLPLNDDDDSDELPPVIELYHISRGITCVDNTILIGKHNGAITVVQCSDTNVALKNPLTAHDYPIVALATCAYDHITVSADVNGSVNVWSRNLQKVTKRISTGLCISALNILRKHALCGTFQGQILLFSVQTGELVAEVTAHSREVSAISVAPESAYMLTASYDGTICIWKLHTRRPEAFNVEFRHCEKLENQMITGAHFLNGRGNGFAATTYDYARIAIFRIGRKLAA